jgi:hypothetical protein
MGCLNYKPAEACTTTTMGTLCPRVGLVHGAILPHASVLVETEGMGFFYACGRREQAQMPIWGEVKRE